MTHAADGPCVVTPGDVDGEKGDVAVRPCSPGDDHPFRDGSGRATDEERGVRYEYVDGERRRVRLEFEDDG